MRTQRNPHQQQINSEHLHSALTVNSSGEPVLKFYYLDANESDTPGKVYLFGKILLSSTNTYVSCCVVVTNIPRRIFILPSKAAQSLDSASQEFVKLAYKYKIINYIPKVVRKKYAFDIEEVPEETDYIEVKYPASCPMLPRSHLGSDIEHIFGTCANALEILLTERGMKGPSWLEIKFPVFAKPQDNETWCKCQVSCSDMETITVVKEENGEKHEIPPMVSTTLNIRTRVSEKKVEVIMIYMLTQMNVDISGTSVESPVTKECCFIVNGVGRPENCSVKTVTSINVIECPDKEDLLKKFLEKIKSLDPDILIGYDCETSLINLMHGIMALKPIPNDTGICRLKNDVRKIMYIQNRTLRKVLHRPLCDVRVVIKEINPKLDQEDFDKICSIILKTEVGALHSLPSWKIQEFLDSPAGTFEIINITRRETDCIIQLTRQMNILPLAVEMTTIAGHVLSKALVFPRNERSEFLLRHEFHEAGYIIPDMHKVKKTCDIRGGLVLEADVGLHENVAILMDFRSLYPSIIQEYNLCFTTMPGVCFKPLEDVKINPEAPVGILPRIVGRIIESRKEAKRLLKDPANSPAMKLKYQARQLALKLTINTLYGCLGSHLYQFYTPNIASIITAKGREVLTNTVSTVESIGFNVIYGDTDSVLINTKQKDRTVALDIATSIKETINAQYKHIELEHEMTYKCVLMANKKIYTGLYFDDLPDGSTQLVLEAKGKVLKEKYCCQLVDTTVHYVLNEIFSDERHDKKINNIEAYLQKIGKMRGDKLLEAVIPSLVITKKLLHDPEDSPNTRAAHVDLAIRLNKTAPGTWREGHFISYIICVDETDNPPEKRAYLKGTNLKPDLLYYFIQELIPPLVSLFKPIPELHAEFFADFLGVRKEWQNSGANGAKSGQRRLIPIEGFCFKCRNCGSRIGMYGFNRKQGRGYIPVLSSCSNPECDVAPWEYVDKIILDLEGHIVDFMEKHPPKIMCTFNKCDWVTEKTKTMPKTCPKCKLNSEFRRDLPVAACYGRVNLLRTWFDVDAQAEVVRKRLRPEIIEAYRKVSRYLINFMEERSVSVVDINKLFV
ncbi:DNA polymerase alpha catalytic subunit [Diachasma alloeum]|uniref:DNA polymerase alpha catalytic subunit n=1 Tax=Diachasma alloeum TaxID=454923 RepID=UPI0007381D3E|nr:DNA polymerase alpha catalytic subunit [Diachasma alloeum]XP_015115783.1 DNA polymerase alpha catalytic subunit [Diachasma alloeum]